MFKINYSLVFPVPGEKDAIMKTRLAHSLVVTSTLLAASAQSPPQHPRAWPYMGKNLPSAEQSGSRRATRKPTGRCLVRAWVLVCICMYMNAKHTIGRPRTGARATQEPVSERFVWLSQSASQAKPKYLARSQSYWQTRKRRKKNDNGGKKPKISQGDRAEMCSRQPFLTLLIAPTRRPSGQHKFFFTALCRLCPGKRRAQTKRPPEKRRSFLSSALRGGSGKRIVTLNLVLQRLHQTPVWHSCCFQHAIRILIKTQSTAAAVVQRVQSM